MRDVTPEILDQIAHRLRALGHPVRLRILHAIEAGELPVHRIVDAVGGSQANVSKQLGLLWNAGLVERRRDGLAVYYRLADERMIEICRTLCDTLVDTTAERLASLTRTRDRIRRRPHRAPAPARRRSR